MNNTEFTYLLKEIIILKQTLASDNGFIKNFIAIIPATITSATTLIGIWWLFKNNYAKEEKFKAENDAKELKLKLENEKKELSDKHRDIYSNLFYLEDEIYTLLRRSYQAAIDSEYFHYISYVENNEEAKDYKIKSDTYYENHLVIMDKAMISGGKFNKNVAEYDLLFPNSQVMLLVNDLSEKGIEYVPTKKFSFDMDEDTINETRDFQLKELNEYISNDLGLKFSSIVNMIKIRK